MPKKYAIPVVEGNRELIQFLNEGDEIKAADRTTYFLFNIDSPTKISIRGVAFEDDLYDEHDFLNDPDITILT